MPLIYIHVPQYRVMLVVWQLVMLTWIFKFHQSAHLLCPFSQNPSSPAGSVITQINLNPTQLSDHQHHPVCIAELSNTSYFIALLVDCKMTWSNWTTCDKSCRGGNRYRTRIVEQFPQFGGKDCPRGENGKIVVENCNNDPCPGEELVLSLL